MDVRLLEVRQVGTFPLSPPPPPLTNIQASYQMMSLGSGPYPSMKAALGGLPTVGVDVPICSVFLLLFLLGAISHLTIYMMNKRRGHRFIISGMMFGFCMARIVTQVMRIVWACYPRNVSIAIAANVFVAAGVVLLFIINVLFAQRIIRAGHPRSGWHPIFHWAFIAIYILIVLSLIMLITSVIQSSFTLNDNTKRIDRDILLYGQTFYTVIAFLPIPLVVGALLVPRKQRLEKFGSGRWRHKIYILLASSTLLCLGAAFRTGANYAGGERPRDKPAGYQSKACFYIFNFVVEIIVIIGYVVLRVDTRFWVPNGSHAPGDYSRGKEDLTSETRGEGRLERAIIPEEEVFDDMSAEELSNHASGSKNGDVEKGDAAVKNTELEKEKETIQQPASAVVPQTKEVQAETA